MFYLQHGKSETSSAFNVTQWWSDIGPPIIEKPLLRMAQSPCSISPTAGEIQVIYHVGFVGFAKIIGSIYIGINEDIIWTTMSLWWVWLQFFNLVLHLFIFCHAFNYLLIHVFDNYGATTHICTNLSTICPT